MKWTDIPQKWLRIGFILGVLLFIIGTLDPLEGSVLIALASLILAGVTHLYKDPHKKYYLIAALLILPGVFNLFYLSSLGGFGGDSELSPWWGLLIAPYPAGWLFILGLLFLRLFAKGRPSG